MKKLTKLLAVFALLAGVLGVAANQKETVVAKAATVQTHRRVYVYLGGAWDNPGHMYIHYWNSGGDLTTWGNKPEMVNVLSDYYQGLFFYDLPINAATFMVVAYSGDTAEKNKSADILVNDLEVSGNYKAIAVGAWVADNTKRVVSIVENLPVNTWQAAAVLNNINSCSTSYASGYNAWPQLNDLFITPSTLDLNTVVTDNFGGDTTIGNKTTWLANQYNLDQAASPQRFSQFDNTKNIAALTTIGVMGLTALAGFYFLKTKKQ